MLKKIFAITVCAIMVSSVAEAHKCFATHLFPEINENCSHEISMSVNAKGVIRISVGMFCSAGGTEVPNTEYVYRYQNNDFFLIGKDYGSFSRYSGEAEKVSENYLTHKKHTITYNMFEKGDEKEKWSTLPSKPLEKLGAKLLEPFCE